MKEDQDHIEHKLKDRFSGFSVQPSDDLWSSIEQKLDEVQPVKRKGRRIYPFILALCLLGGGTAAYLSADFVGGILSSGDNASEFSSTKTGDTEKVASETSMLAGSVIAEENGHKTSIAEQQLKASNKAVVPLEENQNPAAYLAKGNFCKDQPGSDKENPQNKIVRIEDSFKKSKKIPEEAVQKVSKINNVANIHQIPSDANRLISPSAKAANNTIGKSLDQQNGKRQTENASEEVTVLEHEYVALTNLPETEKSKPESMDNSGLNNKLKSEIITETDKDFNENADQHVAYQKPGSKSGLHQADSASFYSDLLSDKNSSSFIKNTAGIDSVSEDTLSEEILVIANEKEQASADSVEAKNKRDAQMLSLDLYFSPELNYRQTYSNAPAAMEHRTGMERPVVALTAGIGANIPLKGKLQFRTGLAFSHYSEKFYVIEQKEQAWKDTSYNMTVSDVIIGYDNGQPVYGKDTSYTMVVKDTSANRDVRSDYSNTYNYIGIPVTFRYVIKDHAKLNIDITGGVIANIWVGGKREISQGNNMYVRENYKIFNSDSPFRPFALTLQAQIGFSHNLTDKLSIMLNPGIKYFLTPVYKSSEAVQTKPYTAGVEMGLRLNL